MAQQAHKLLARRHENKWLRSLDDDNIWHLATEAEVYLLLEQWSEAADTYRRAFAEPKVTPFHRETAGRQARRILDAWRRLGGEPPAPGFPLDSLFPPPPAADAAAPPG
jgi:hypothetical protein